MYILEIEHPGTWLEFNPKEIAWEIQGVLSQIESVFTEAVIALNLFELERTKDYFEMSKEYNEALSKKREEILKSKDTNSSAYNFNITAYDEVDIEARREIWKTGIPPQEFTHSLIFIYAKSFLFSLDNIYKLVDVLSRYKNIPIEVSEARDKLKSNFPNLIGVRNSTHHIEDRIRGLERNEKKIKLKPIDNTLIKSAGGALVLNSLNNNRYGCTMADGHYGEVEVSSNTLSFVRDAIQKILTSFSWTGQSSIYPG